MCEEKSYDLTGPVNDEILSLAATFARIAMRKWCMDIIGECEVKEYDRSLGRYTNVTIFDYEGYHTRVTALKDAHYNMQALRKHYACEGGHTMGIRITGENEEREFTIDFKDMSAIGGLMQDELRTMSLYREDIAPLNQEVNIEGFEVTVTEVTETTEESFGKTFYRQSFTIAAKNRLAPEKPYIFKGRSARRTRPYGTAGASTGAVKTLLIEHEWEM